MLLGWISSLLLALTAGGQVEKDLVIARKLLSASSISKVANEKLLEMTKDADLREETVLYAYHAAGIMSMANHSFWPTTKFDYFNKGKDKLEKAVNFALTNVEIRWIRYTVQDGTPGMLGYKGNMEEDKAYILENIGKTDWSNAYKEEVKAYLN